MGCMGSGPARCKKCARGYSLKGAKCLGKDLLFSGLNELYLLWMTFALKLCFFALPQT